MSITIYCSKCSLEINISEPSVWIEGGSYIYQKSTVIAWTSANQLKTRLSVYTYLSFSITFLWLQHTSWGFACFQVVYIIFIKFGPMLAILTNSTLTCSDVKQNQHPVSKQNRLTIIPRRAELTAIPFTQYKL